METLTELLPQLKSFDSILVTGPQRSGTTIGGHILAEELGYRYADENEINIYDYLKAINLLHGGQVVLQAPGLCYLAHWFNTSKIAVVVMRRNLEDIYKSEMRIGWRDAYGGANLKAEIDRYQAMYGKTPDNGNIAELKYKLWDTLQKKLCNGFDLDYESLRGHPLWKEERTNFKERQFT
jgi:hypothetical protein